jgi:putative solute:sodium symporter small subunit
MMDSNLYWRKTRSLTLVLLGIWVVITFGFPWFAQELNDFSLFGFPLGFYMAAQGTLVIYLFLIWIYNRRMRQLEKRFGIDDE